MSAINCYAQSFEIKEIELPNPEHAPSWRQLVKNPRSSTQFFLANRQGQISILNNEQVQAPALLDLKTFYPNLIALTAFTTHPAFNLSKQVGYLSFYTAHIEKPNEEANPNPISPYRFEQATPYQLVLSEWQLKDKTESLTLKRGGHKTILRIDVPSVDITIEQLSFSPFIQPWQDNYGQLLMTLGTDKNYQKIPLYSGAILRIQPEKFGTKNYRVPQSNPFIEQITINNEIVAAHLGKIHSIYWSKQHTEALFINHELKQKLNWSQITLGSDFIESSVKANTFYSAAQSKISNSIVYRGNKLKSQRNKVLYLSWQDQWRLMSTDSQSPEQPEIIHQFNRQEISADAELMLVVDQQNEPIIFNQSNASILHLLADNAQTLATTQQSNIKQQAPESSLVYLIAMIVIVVILIVIWLSKRSALPTIKKYLHSQYAQFDVNEAENQIALYQRHHKDPSLELSLSQIIESSIYLNGECLSTVRKNKKGAFSNQKERAVIAEIAKEQREKMVDDRIRKCELLITDSDKNSYRVCNYFRKGNQRLTKAKFEQATEQLIDWCWKISSVMNPQHTEARKIPVQAEVTLANTDSKIKEKLETKESILKPTVSQEAQQPSKAIDVNTTAQLAQTTEGINKTKENTSNAAQTDLDPQQKLQQELTSLSIVEALEKLAQLKQQSLLTEQEFEQAKSKILNLP
ncbi:hypothetical protein tinsulaeT_15600 [Thalassotalea insulae]|uniref:SHOCT domain-containing protein n=2 Tax=Thalassotalea insulae TaxID=2056778 RepID=A0ABQ6GUP3_9GAMM|nr:hypothetical protein tinsulaeT_15600 [Thalassotalea insulae]